MKLFSDTEVYKYILRIALPAIAGLSSQMIVSLIDTAMVGRIHDAEYALAAMGLGVLSTWAVVSFFSSIATGTHIVVARRFGEKNYEKCGEALNTSIIFTFIVGIIVAFIVISSAYSIGDFFAADDRVGELAGDYLFYRFMGLPFFLISVSYRGFFFGIGNTKVFMYSGLLANFLNIILNYILIFGAFGIPAMGLAGAGLASSFATVSDSFFQFLFSAKRQHRRKFGYFRKIGFSTKVVRMIYSLSIPVSLQNIFILVGFLSFIAMIGLIGTVEQAASQAVISCVFISLMPTFGFGVAVQTLVGNNLGSNKIQHAKFFAYKTAQIASLYTLIIGVVFISIPEWVLMLITDSRVVLETGAPALQIAGFAQIFYAVGVVLANGLQASGRTLFVMISEVTVNWIIFVPLAYVLSIVFDLGLIGAWSAMPVYVVIYSTIIFLKFRYGNWSNLRRV